MNRRPILILVLIALIPLLAGCAADARKEELLNLSLEGYGASLRWGDFRSALNYVDPEERPDPARINFVLQRFDQIRVTSYRDLDGGPGVEPNTIMQTAEIRLINKHTAVERTIIDRQVWRWDEVAERWWLTTGLPNISRTGR